MCALLDEDKKWSSGKITLKNPMKTKRKKIPLEGYKIEEDWRSDDSDWESSDEELKKKKRRSELFNFNGSFLSSNSIYFY